MSFGPLARALARAQLLYIYVQKQSSAYFTGPLGLYSRKKERKKKDPVGSDHQQPDGGDSPELGEVRAGWRPEQDRCRHCRRDRATLLNIM